MIYLLSMSFDYKFLECAGDVTTASCDRTFTKMVFPSDFAISQ